ncbi:hypothetical protein [Sphaerisporangium aureirubrum]|uniref:Uncharacterized protein n=1 Tax=Sphaerisporangium aureirubrum TaxID=1544736 RepID=A0ABW1NWV6_9ACTN
MTRSSSWKTAGLVVTLGAGVFVATGSVAHAEPEPGPVELRLVLDDCREGTPTVAP